MDELSKSSNVDFPNLIALALQKSLPWDSLCIIVDNVALTQEQSKSVIKLLLKELQKLQENPKESTEIAEATKEENVSEKLQVNFKKFWKILLKNQTMN